MRLPARPGTYALLLACDQDVEIRIGSLGNLRLQPGWYVYVGSALGPGGLKARVSRHERRSKTLRWHIDYLRAVAAIDEVWYTLDGVRRECLWAEALAQMADCSSPMPGFGASDCSCLTHLFCFAEKPSMRLLRSLTRGRMPDHGAIRRISTARLRALKLAAGRSAGRAGLDGTRR